MSKSMLVLKASKDISQLELMNVMSHSQMHGIQSDLIEITTESDLIKCLYSGKKYNYIYLATHACSTSFGESDGRMPGSLNISWIKFAAYVCSSGVAEPGAIFFHSCCRGGVNRVGWEMFACCQSIEYVCGPRHNASPVDLTTAFNLFIYLVENRRMDPVRASEKVLQATDVRLVCLDRVETECNVEYKCHRDLIQEDIDSAFGSLIHEPEEIKVEAGIISPELSNLTKSQASSTVIP